MNQEIFADHLKKGLGSVILFMKHNTNNQVYEDIIYEYAIHNHDYDKQCEESKAQYLWEIISYSGISDIMERRVLDSLGRLVDGYDIEQVYRLAVCFYKSGNSNCIDILKQNYIFNNDWNCFIGSEEIIELAGEEGLLFVMGEICGRFSKDKQYDGEDYTLEYAYEKIGKERVVELIQPLMNSNIQFQNYILEKKVYVNHNNTNRIGTYTDIRKELLELPFYKLRRWGIVASEEELELAANELLVETDEAKIIKLLYIFQKRKFPKDISKIIGFVDSTNEDLSCEAVHILKKFSDNIIHEKAILLIKKKDNWYDYLKLLINNYKYSDCKIIINRLNENYDEDILHAIQLGIIEILEANCDSTCKELLKKMYYLGPCTLCRKKLVNIMLTNQLIDEKILKEIAYDSNIEIRELVANIK